MTAALYHPAWHVPFQLDMMAQSYLWRQALNVGDLGTGKTHVGMGVAAYALMQGDADLVLVCCEKNKLTDWKKEIETHSSMAPAVIYHGPARAKRLAGRPVVLITTYETARQDIGMFASKRARLPSEGPLMEWLLTRRPVVIYDEASAKLGNRGSTLYRAHASMLAKLRKKNRDMIVLGLTGTPIERDWENAYNTMRLIAPGLMPSVTDFESYYTYGRDDYRRLRFRRDRMPEFAAICQQRMLRKRKTDPDVRDQFPPMTEQFLSLEMHPDQAKIYRVTEDLAWTSEGYAEVPGLRTVLRQLAGYPFALLNSEGKLAQLMSETIREQLHACSSVKAEKLLEYASQVCGEDGKLLVFTFFGQSILPVLKRELEATGLPLFVTHGAMTIYEQERERDRYRTCKGAAALLSSDAGARGVNLPETSCVVEYESALTHALRTQRFGRAHRLGRTSGPLTCITFVVEDTIEVPLLRGALNRNVQHDQLTGDGDLDAIMNGQMTAAERKGLYACARKRKT